MSKGNTFESNRSRRQKATIFDLDGTLAQTTDPNANHKINHDGFRTTAQQAPVNQDILDKLLKAKKNGDEIVILTARSAHYRSDTVRWLNENGVPYDSLVMRPADDDRKDKVVKRALLEEHVLPYFEPKKAYDDKKKNRKMFEQHGIDAKGVK